MTQPTMIFNRRDGQRGVIEHMVREDDVCRPDLIAIEYYGDQTKTDLILKFNGISDPFSLNVGDVILIPPSGIAFHKLERPGITEDNPIKNQFLQDKRLPKKDDRRIEALKKKYNKDVLLPPNVIPLGKKNYKFDKGLVTFGAQAQNAEVNDPVVTQIMEDFSSTGAGVDDGQQVVDIQVNSSGSGSGSGGGRGLTETQLDNLLTNGGNPTSGKGAGGDGTKADDFGTNADKGDAPQGTGNADGVSNDGAPCN